MVASCDLKLLAPPEGAAVDVEGLVEEGGGAVVAAVEGDAVLDVVLADELHAAPAITTTSASRPTRGECLVTAQPSFPGSRRARSHA
jgi:hypothetical protein